MADFPSRRKNGSGWRRFRWPLLVAVVALAAVGLLALLTNIMERRQEARNPFYRVVELTDTTTNPATWGKNFPLHYDSYRRTVDMERTRYGGSEAVSKQPTATDPREVVSSSRLVEDPRLREFWAGYAFAEDFREERGHAYMLDDQTFTGRQAVAQPGACIHCHASAYAAYLELGDGDIHAGFHALNKMPYADARRRVEHPVACVDCHDPRTMRLRITRPAFMTGIAALKALEGVKDYDVNAQATRQEMRSYVCAQCHVEYSFQGEGKTLTYPWSKGLKADQILAYYDELGFKDWTHAVTGAPALKAQHPEFEMWSQGTHARAGVSCADCHMPYKRVGSQKISSHHVRSPMLDINAACQTCHKAPEDELKARVEAIQGRHLELRDLAVDAVVRLIGAIEAAQQAGQVDPRRLDAARDLQRKAQFLADFAEAENSAGFHAPQEAARVLALAIDLAWRGQAALWQPADAPDAAAQPPAAEP